MYIGERVGEQDDSTKQRKELEDGFTIRTEILYGHQRNCKFRRRMLWCSSHSGRSKRGEDWSIAFDLGFRQSNPIGPKEPCRDEAQMRHVVFQSISCMQQPCHLNSTQFVPMVSLKSLIGSLPSEGVDGLTGYSGLWSKRWREGLPRLSMLSRDTSRLHAKARRFGAGYDYIRQKRWSWENLWIFNQHDYRDISA